MVLLNIATRLAGIIPPFSSSRGSPYIEEDDMVELQQIVYEGMGPLAIKQWLATRTQFEGVQDGLPQPGWRNL